MWLSWVRPAGLPQTHKTQKTLTLAQLMLTTGSGVNEFLCGAQ